MVLAFDDLTAVVWLEMTIDLSSLLNLYFCSVFMYLPDLSLPHSFNEDQKQVNFSDHIKWSYQAIQMLILYTYMLQILYIALLLS